VGLGFELASAIPPYTTATATATITMTSTSTSSPTSSPSSTNNSLGIGLGVALGVVLLAVVAALVLYRMRRVHRLEGGQQGGPLVGYATSYDDPKAELEQANMIHESPSQSEPVEMDGDVRRH
jgi:hypothetical protein